MIACRQLSFTPVGAAGPVLADVSLAIGPGERVGIVGPSGAGKSTLGYHLCGAHRLALAGRTEGGLRLDGRDGLAGGPPGFAGIVGQNPEVQLFCATVGEEVALGLRARGLAAGACREAVGLLLARYGLAGRAEAALGTLSLGQKQLAAVLSMLAIRPKVLLLDEPTSYLDAATADLLFAHLDALSRETGLVVMVIEHDLARLSGFADRYLALDRGRLAYDGPASGFPVREPLPPARPLAPGRASGAPALAFAGVSFGYGKTDRVLADIDLAVGPGEVVALMGPNGSGKSTLLRLAKGLGKPRTGRIALAPGLAGGRDVGLMFQNPDEQIFAHTVAAECGYWLDNLEVPEPARTRRVARELAGLGLDRVLDRSPFTLSFGEKRRLCLAAVLVADPAVLCLDEPTTGLDDATMAAMAETVRGRAGQGAAVLVATHEQAFAAMAATRIVRLENGRIVADAPNPEGRRVA
ncbi:ABC transporter related protein [Solidesulfovibrio carbinoliphilus subsp. oakridgensis]|uniref:ABC transporter related protein n=1 Tax=Solidesulfovibrio carbinoliphilus subsp. oakridgensis TaxID=694327 RepID=G7Q6R5_9BACT|nr:ABC transporter ATP-binding protein [Solidesulfovibrio carbinoliphilus]EHJ48000.1 ABC transporter related protein [Solidesulfovibrio carbinoliphilus subsp. oakridgensis]